MRENLPGANCGACGYPGCDGLAEALAAGDAQVSACSMLSQENAEKIGALIGDSAVESKSKVARVMCQADECSCKDRLEYEGTLDCRAAYRIGGTFKTCEFACLGLGTCAKVCKFDAVTMGNDGIPMIDEEKCVGCGACEEQCPKCSIVMQERDVAVYAACNNTNLALEVLRDCSVGCIGCGKCEKVCKFKAIKMENNLPIMNTELCTGCGICAEECPRKCIVKTKPDVVAKICLQTCKGCSVCKAVCVFEAIEGDFKMKHKVNEQCKGCGLCMEACKFDAISMVEA